MRKPDMCAPDITAEVESGRRQDIQEEVRFLGHDREDIDRRPVKNLKLIISGTNPLS